MIAPPLLLALALASAADPVVVRVDGAAITRAAVAQRVRAQTGTPAPDVVLETLVAETLLASEARRLGIASTREVTEVIDAEARRAAAAALVDDLGARAQLDEPRMREAFHRTADFVAFESLTFEKREEALGALERLRRGAAPADEARRAVVSSLAVNPEDQAPVMRGQLPAALADALLSAAPGAWVGPVDAGKGFVVGRVIRKEIGTEAQYAERREALMRSGKAQAVEAAKRHLVEQARAKAKITIDEPFLRGLSGTRATPAQLDHVVATVNGSAIRYRDVYDAVRALGGSGQGHLSGPMVKRQLVAKEVDARLLQAVAEERGLLRSPAVAAQRSFFERVALARAAAARIQAGAPAPSEDEIADFYRKNASAYGAAFEKVLPLVAMDAAERKRLAALDERIRELRGKAAVTVDKKAFADAVAAGVAP